MTTAPPPDLPVADVRIRSAAIDDAPAITAIYNEGIAERIATFETRPRTEPEMAERIGSLAPGQAMLVGLVGRQVLGGAWYGADSERECHRGVGSTRST